MTEETQSITEIGIIGMKHTIFFYGINLGLPKDNKIIQLCIIWSLLKVPESSRILTQNCHYTFPL